MTETEYLPRDVDEIIRARKLPLTKISLRRYDPLHDGDAMTQDDLTEWSFARTDSSRP
ncbi:hypothetical protein ACH9D2_01190 [Kocuria sp. M4R2S49]|uniref:hypothetical protein n=1 Tax=Kocuria rhizosphaericola TaxID=3376284 RepID=UPI0037B6B491